MELLFRHHHYHNGMTLMKPVALLKDGGGQFQSVRPLHDVLLLNHRAVGHALLLGTPNTARAPAV